MLATVSPTSWQFEFHETHKVSKQSVVSSLTGSLGRMRRLCKILRFKCRLSKHWCIRCRSILLSSTYCEVWRLTLSSDSLACRSLRWLHACGQRYRYFERSIPAGGDWFLKLCAPTKKYGQRSFTSDMNITLIWVRTSSKLNSSWSYLIQCLCYYVESSENRACDLLELVAICFLTCRLLTHIHYVRTRLRLLLLESRKNL